jgi:hypothetical protein
MLIARLIEGGDFDRHRGVADLAQLAARGIQRTLDAEGERVFRLQDHFASAALVKP